MSKGPWEERVGWLLQPPDFVWKYKAPDTRFYGGQTRIDFIACDEDGGFWMIEVKQVESSRKTINLDREVSAGQRDALDAIAEVGAWAILAVGRDNLLYIFDWSSVRWWQKEASHGSDLLPLERATVILQWSGKKNWLKIESLRELMLNNLMYTVRTPTPPSEPSVKTDLSQLTLKPLDSIHITRPTRQ